MLCIICTCHIILYGRAVEVNRLPLGLCIWPARPRQPPEGQQCSRACGPGPSQKLFEPSGPPPRVGFRPFWGGPKRGVGPVDQGACSAAQKGSR